MINTTLAPLRTMELPAVPGRARRGRATSAGREFESPRACPQFLNLGANSGDRTHHGQVRPGALTPAVIATRGEDAPRGDQWRMRRQLMGHVALAMAMA